MENKEDEKMEVIKKMIAIMTCFLEDHRKLENKINSQESIQQSLLSIEKSLADIAETLRRRS